jgi:hypothetical protein
LHSAAGFAAVEAVENVVAMVTRQQFSSRLRRRKISRSSRKRCATVGSGGRKKKRNKKNE